MARRAIAGIIGGVAAALPVAAVNTASAYGLLDAQDTQTAMLIGTVALLSGAALGGLVAGAWAGRRGGSGAAGVAGTLAAGIYVASVVARLAGLLGPRGAAADPISTTASLAFVAALLIGIAMLVGRLTFRGGAVAQSAPSYPRQPAAPAADPSHMQRPPSPSGARYGRAPEPSAPRWPDRAAPPSAPRYPAGMPSRSGAERGEPRYRR
jgi:hypothetical protein